MNRIVVSDTTAITHLAKIDALNILHKLYTEILIPKAVFDELSQVKRTQPGALSVMNSTWIKVVEGKKQNYRRQADEALGPGRVRSDRVVGRTAIGRFDH